MLSSPEECGLASVKPNPTFPFQNQNKSLDKTVRFLRHPACRQTFSVSFTASWCSARACLGLSGGEVLVRGRERRMDLFGEREREGWRGGRISIQASQGGYKEFIKVWTKCFLPLPSTAGAVMQRNSFLSDHYRRFLEGNMEKLLLVTALIIVF